MRDACLVVFLFLLPGTAPGATPADFLHLQIVAHQDDDFLFMNPDLARAIGAGHGIVTVYLTAGQSVGTAGGVTPVLNREQFAAARQRGIRATYAQMTGVANNWSRSLVVPDGVHTVEVYTLVAAPRIRLYFMNLPDGGDDQFPHTNAPSNMWGDASYVTNTIVPLCFAYESCGIQPVPLQFYDRAGVLSVLTAIVDALQPTVVRTLDPQPFESSQVSYDNLDHTAAARFADAVLSTYHGPNASRRYSLNHYKGYSFVNYPRGLGYADTLEKTNTALTYQPYDPNYNYYAANYEPWYHAMWERYPGSTTWLERSGDGRLVLATVEDRRVHVWHEQSPGGPWQGPAMLAGDVPLAPHVTLIRRPDGLLQLFALRLPLERENWSPAPSLPKQEVVTAVQRPTSAADPIRFGPWSVVGSPDSGTCGVFTCQFAGPQTAAIDGTGRTFVFAKNSAGRLRYTSSTGGTWTSWTTPTAEDIVDGIAAHTRDDGRVEVFVTGRSGRLHRFVQQAGTTLFTYDNVFVLSFGGAASAPTVTKNQDGRPEIFYREADTGRVLTVYETPGGSWAGPVVLYGDAGTGPIAALRRNASGHIMLFERNVWAGISSTWQAAPNNVFHLQWQIRGGAFIEYPAAASDALGRAVVAVKGGDGQIHLQRETSSTIGSFGPWTPIAAPCQNGIDDDGDGHADYPLDPGCRHATFPTEAPECNDRIDNDGDGRTDLGDGQCKAAADRSERIDCGNGIDDDGDGLVDTADEGCLTAAWPTEDPACSDEVDNDLDERLDWDGAGLGGPDDTCAAPFGLVEVPEPGRGAWTAALLATFELARARHGRPQRMPGSRSGDESSSSERGPR
jgi:LmbE family N-acetylglucosaminyl deacetylase